MLCALVIYRTSVTAQWREVPQEHSSSPLGLRLVLGNIVEFVKFL